MKKINKSSLSTAIIVVGLGLMIFSIFKVSANAIIELNDRVNKLESYIYNKNNANDIIDKSTIKNNNSSFLCPYCNNELDLNTTEGKTALAYFDCRSCGYKSPTISKYRVKVSNDEECADILKRCFISGDWSIIK